MNKKIEIVTVHFGDARIVNKLHSKILEYDNGQIEKIHIIDADKNPCQLIPTEKVEVHRFRPDPRIVEITGHSHPSLLNDFFRSKIARDCQIILLDSDCWPISKDWLNCVEEFHLAEDPGRPHLSHPCFNSFPSYIAHELDYSDGLFNNQVDTGRLIMSQLVKMNKKPVLEPVNGRAFGGKWGYFYLKGALYHHGSASFASSKSEKLQSQVHRCSSIYLDLALEDKMTLKYKEKLKLFFKNF